MMDDIIDSVETARLGAVMQTHFMERPRNEYAISDGHKMPLKYAEMHNEILNLNVDDKDVWVCSFPRTGTTWTQEMVWMIMNNLDFERAKLNLYERSPFLEVSSLCDFKEENTAAEDAELPPYLKDSLQFVKNQTSSVCIKTHLSFNLLPKEIQNGIKKPKIVYVTRNPKDACVSFYHHQQMFRGYTGSLDDFCKLFLTNQITYTHYWDSVLSFWNRRHEDNILYNTYEEMKTDLPSVIRKTAIFLEKDLTDNQVDILAKHLSFESMKSNKSVNHESIIKWFNKNITNENRGKFIRTGIVGSHKEAMSAEMMELFDRWIKKNKENTDFNLY